MLIDATDLKAQVNADFLSFTEAYETAEKGLSGVNHYLERSVSLPFHYEALERRLKATIAQLLRKVSAAHRGQTDASIELDQLEGRHYDFDVMFRKASDVYRRNEVRSDCVDDKIDIADLSQLVLAKLDFEALADQINELAERLPLTGLTEAADFLQRELGLFEKARSWEGKVRRTSRHVVIETTDYSDRYSRARRWKQVSDYMRVFGAEAGVDLVAVGFQDLAAACDALGYEESIPSRTKFGEGHNVMVQTFQQKVKIYFDPETYNAFIAFLQAYSGDPLFEEAIAA